MSDADEMRSAYVPRRVSRSRFRQVRGVRYHVREWGSEDGSPLVLLHGARDSSVSFQFLIDAFAQEWHVVAPDWRGHGLTAWTPGSYWNADFLCDLERVLTVCLPSVPVALVGHSLGGNIASLYAALRPERVSRLVLMDSLGPAPDRVPVRIMNTLQNILDGLDAPESRGYASPAEMASGLRRRNPRLSTARADFVVERSARSLPDDRVAWPHDPTFTRSSPSLYTLDDWSECWRRIRAPVLALVAAEQRAGAALGSPEILRQRASHFRDFTSHTVTGTGHNLHFDAPEVVARTIEDFLLGPVDSP